MWLKISEEFRDEARLQAYHAFLFGLSIIFIIIAFIMIGFSKGDPKTWPWIIPWFISGILIVVATVKYFRSLNLPFLDRVSAKFISPKIYRRDEVREIIEKNEYLARIIEKR